MNAWTYLERYKQTWAELVQTQDERRFQEYHLGLFTTWTMSYEQVRRQNESAAALLRLWAFLDREDLWFELIHTLAKHDWLLEHARWLDRELLLRIAEVGKSGLTFSAALMLLSRYSLVETREGVSGHSIHPVLHEWSLHFEKGPKHASLLYLAMCLVGAPRSPPMMLDRRDGWKVNRRCFVHASRCYPLWAAVHGKG